MKRLSSILASVLLLCGLAACGAPKNEVFVSLRGNALAGYSWVCTTDDLGCVELLEDEYISGDTFCTVGKSGAYAFTYRPVCPGEVTLSYEYLRVGQDDEPLLTAVYRLTVDADNIISLEVLEAPDYPEDMY